MPSSVPLAYRAALGLTSPVVAGWGRLEVRGLEHLAPPGPLLLACSHDSQWDPVIIGVAGLRGGRAISALAKASLWKARPAAIVLDAMQQIPVARGAGDLGALDRAVEVLRAGGCIGMFPEGTLSRGEALRARSGLGRLAEAVPEARILGCAVTGSVDVVGTFPRRPRLTVTFFAPAGGDRREGESPAELSARLLAEVRTLAPPIAAGRRKVR